MYFKIKPPLLLQSGACIATAKRLVLPLHTGLRRLGELTQPPAAPLHAALQPLAIFENCLSKIYFLGESEESGIGKRPFKEQASELAEFVSRWGEIKELGSKKKEERCARHLRRDGHSGRALLVGCRRLWRTGTLSFR